MMNEKLHKKLQKATFRLIKSLLQAKSSERCGSRERKRDEVLRDAITALKVVDFQISHSVAVVIGR